MTYNLANYQFAVICAYRRFFLPRLTYEVVTHGLRLLVRELSSLMSRYTSKRLYVAYAPVPESIHRVESSFP